MSERLLDVPCTKCDLHRSAITVKVSSRGSERPTILLVGEAPGKFEDRKGEAFIGQSGKKLDTLLSEAGIKKEWCRMSNIVRCIPHGESGGVRPPYPDEVEACRDYLEAEIISTDPVFIVPLGMSAIKFFLPHANYVKSARGKRHIVEFPSISFRYKKFRKWVDFKKRTETFPVVYSDKKMLAQMEEAKEHGFATLPSKQYTVWPTYHPSAVLRGNAEAEQYMIEDLTYLRHQVTGESSVPWGNYKLLLTLDEVKESYDHIKNLYLSGQIPHVAADIETTSVPKKMCPIILQIYLCSFFELLGFCLSWGNGHSVFIPFNHPESPFYHDKLSLDAVVSMTNELFEVVPLVGHNFKFDTHGFWKAGIKPKKVADDTMLASWTLFNDTCDHGLEPLATKWTGMLAHKEEMTSALASLPKYLPLENRYHRADGQIPRFCIDDENGTIYRPSNMGDVPLPLVAKYCNSDGDSTFKLQAIFEAMLREQNMWEPHQTIPVRSVLPVARMERDGIKIDRPMFAEAAADFEKRLSEKEKWFEDYGYFEEALDVVKEWVKKPPKKAKLTNTNIKRAIVYDILRFPVNKTTPKNQPSADKEALTDCLEQCLKYKGKAQDKDGFYSHRIEALNNIISFNKDSKIYTSYLRPIPNLVDTSDIGHCSFGIRTTDTGRFNCREPSWHIIPWRSIVKKAVKPLHDQGLILVSDFSQMELRILAMVTEDKELLKAYSEDRDLHRFVASKCYQCEEDEVTKAQRRDTKAVNFGIVFGRGAPAIAAQLGNSIDESQGLIDMVMTSFPAVHTWIKNQHRKAHKDGEVWTCSGFRRLFQEGVLDKGQIERRAQNTPVQGPASDATAYAMIRMQELLDKIRTLKSIVWATIHDSLCFSIWPGELLSIAMLAKKAMVELTAKELPWLNIPLKNDYEVGVTWGELLDMKLLDTHGHVELDGPTPYFDRFFERVSQWDKMPEVLDIQTHVEKDDDGNDTEYTTSVWNLSV